MVSIWNVCDPDFLQFAILEFFQEYPKIDSKLQKLRGEVFLNLTFTYSWKNPTNLQLCARLSEVWK